VNTASRDLSIESLQGSYVAEFVQSERELLAALRVDDGAFLLADARVAELYPQIVAAFGTERVHRVAATEDEKTLSGVERCCLFLQERGASRASRLVVLGGGIVQDIGTFCAHVYYRGIPYEYVPTTLLSMADSSIGAKCAVNLGAYKNQLGFFQSPRRVLQWPGFLETLTPDDVRSGFGEILKLSITGGRQTYAVFEAHLKRFGFATSEVEPMIALSLGVKKPVIEADEYDRGIRKTLNYGHTFGHALESVTDHQVPHGLAVAWGVDLANFVAWRTGMWPEADFLRVHELIVTRFSLQVRAPYDAAALIAAMGKDKKASGSTVQTILPDSAWTLQLVPQQLGGQFQTLIEEFLKTFDPFLPGRR
jgi:3-dehydroquinate synthase